jgi:hypothetical protein
VRRMDMPHLFIMPGTKAGNGWKPITIVLEAARSQGPETCGRKEEQSQLSDISNGTIKV